MIKVVMVALLLMPNGDIKTHAFPEAQFNSMADCEKVGNAIQRVRKEVLTFKCVEYTEL
jgi:hypothetical protein